MAVVALGIHQQAEEALEVAVLVAEALAVVLLQRSQQVEQSTREVAAVAHLMV